MAYFTIPEGRPVYIVPVKAQVRKSERLEIGDMVAVRLAINF